MTHCPQINGANQSGDNILITQHWEHDVQLCPGEPFEIDNVHNINPETRVSTGKRKQFLMIEELNRSLMDGVLYATLRIFPALVAAGDWQNVDALPANGAAIYHIPKGNAKTKKIASGEWYFDDEAAA